MSALSGLVYKYSVVVTSRFLAVSAVHAARLCSSFLLLSSSSLLRLLILVLVRILFPDLLPLHLDNRTTTQPLHTTDHLLLPSLRLIFKVNNNEKKKNKRKRKNLHLPISYSYSLSLSFPHLTTQVRVDCLASPSSLSFLMYYQVHRAFKKADNKTPKKKRPSLSLLFFSTERGQVRSARKKVGNNKR